MRGELVAELALDWSTPPASSAAAIAELEVLALSTPAERDRRARRCWTRPRTSSSARSPPRAELASSPTFDQARTSLAGAARAARPQAAARVR